MTIKISIYKNHSLIKLRRNEIPKNNYLKQWNNRKLNQFLKNIHEEEVVAALSVEN